MSWNSPIDPPIVQNLNIDMSASHFGVWFTVHAPWCIHRASPPPHKTTPSPAHLSLPPFQPTHFISFLCSISPHSIRTTGNWNSWTFRTKQIPMNVPPLFDPSCSAQLQHPNNSNWPKETKANRVFQISCRAETASPLDIENLVATDISRRPIKRIINWLSTDIKHNQTELL